MINKYKKNLINNCSAIEYIIDTQQEHMTISRKKLKQKMIISSIFL